MRCSCTARCFHRGQTRHVWLSRRDSTALHRRECSDPRAPPRRLLTPLPPQQRDPALTSGDSTRLPLLIDSLGAGAELFNSAGSGAAASASGKAGGLFAMRREAEEEDAEGVDEVRLVLGAQGPTEA